MKLQGLNIEIIRGETASVSFTLTDTEGKPLRLLLEDMFETLQVRFKVKADPYAKSLPTYIIEKVYDISEIKRFSVVDILNIKTYDPVHYSQFEWADTLVIQEADKNRLFYHPDLREYRYYDDSGDTPVWNYYEAVVTVSFDPADTFDLDYKEYVYDLILEASNTPGQIEYVNVLIEQRPFTVTYQV